ncbi:MAG TPA: L-threonylcarbamoyladenylate synthase [Dehalococcoidales bacterium]|nr:L-threonylcarbamoyladenylate synthase [Dehalococcoidales bacterium]
MGTRLSSSVREQVEQGISILKRGGVVAFPTDTVYGLGAGIGIDSAVERVYRIKGRPNSRALPLILADLYQFEKVAREVTPTARLLADNFWPGPLTLVLLKSDSVSAIITGGSETVAVRIPAHPIPVALARGVGTAVVGTSANLSGQPSALTAAEARAQLGDKADLIINGECPGGKESTIVDLTGETPVILRQGAISREELRQICPDIAVKGG